MTVTRMRVRHVACMVAVSAPKAAKPPAEMPRSVAWLNETAHCHPDDSKRNRNADVSAADAACPTITTTNARQWPTRRS